MEYLNPQLASIGRVVSSPALRDELATQISALRTAKRRGPDQTQGPLQEIRSILTREGFKITDDELDFLESDIEDVYGFMNALQNEGIMARPIPVW